MNNVQDQFKESLAVRNSTLPGHGISVVTLHRQPDGDELKELMGKLVSLPQSALRISFATPSVVNAPCDLSFLADIPNLVRLDLRYAWRQSSFDFLPQLRKIRSLDLGGLGKPCPLSVLGKLPELEMLEISAKKTDLNGVQNAQRLRILKLREISINNFLALEKMPSLQELVVISCKIGSFEGLDSSKVRKLMLQNILGCGLDFLGNMKNLRELRIHEMPKIKSLPSLAGLEKLQFIELSEMTGIQDLSALAQAPCLEELHVNGAPKMNVAAFASLTNHVKLQRASIRIGSQAKKEEALRLLAINKPHFEILP